MHMLVEHESCTLPPNGAQLAIDREAFEKALNKPAKEEERFGRGEPLGEPDALDEAQGILRCFRRRVLPGLGEDEVGGFVGNILDAVHVPARNHEHVAGVDGVVGLVYSNGDRALNDIEYLRDVSFDDDEARRGWTHEAVVFGVFGRLLVRHD